MKTVENFNTDDIRTELRAKHAKLNELSDAQSDAADAAIDEALTIGFSSGLVEGILAEQVQRKKVLIGALTFRTFVVALLSVQFAGGLFLAFSNPVLSFVGAAVVLTFTFYATDKFFYFGLPVVAKKLEAYIAKREASKQKKDELPK